MVEELRFIPRDTFLEVAKIDDANVGTPRRVSVMLTKDGQVDIELMPQPVTGEHEKLICKVPQSLELKE